MNKKNLATFADVKTFFKSWGLYPSEETDDMEADGESPDVLENGINRACYSRLIRDADKYIRSPDFPDYFPNFCRRQIDATDGSFYLTADTWDELQEAWEDYLLKL